MLGGLAKANIWVARPGGSESVLFLPLDMLRGLARPGGSESQDTILNKYKAPCRHENAWSERPPDLSPKLLSRSLTSRKPPRRAMEVGKLASL
jgi:hypothetical protein